MIRTALISPLVQVACAARQSGESVFAPASKGAGSSLLDDDLVQAGVAMAGARSNDDATDYADCVVAQHALGRGFGFARHLRTNVNEKGGVWRADAVYTISPSLPRGLETIDAKVMVAGCVENGIPTV
ncbi:hypothetical protein QO034_04620 [Sedimentitalea sp. JM2-8]|uniref:Lipoprotein n=1 Tax=Sedimentitalea xiamensis TaxID=3050037 RepID=A0ABT7FBB1_9RHOB|nr:hypothetical protein [Sedimentitalea xiamensis]MDK3072388.1 hypothetical protein [Sedimentitalea xiamensis]